MRKRDLIDKTRDILEGENNGKIVRDTLVLNFGEYKEYKRTTVEIKYDLFNHVQIQLLGQTLHFTPTCTLPREDIIKTVTISKIFNKKTYSEFQKLLEYYGIRVD